MDEKLQIKKSVQSCVTLHGIIEDMNQRMVELGGERMRWILLKFLKDSLDYLSTSRTARKTKRKEWIIDWQKENLQPEVLNGWLPREEQFGYIHQPL
jgi:hypothetical protein